MRDALGKEPVAAAELVVDPNSYPKEIRGTLRDAVSYLLVDLLADTAGWTPEQSNEVWRLDLGALLKGESGDVAQIDLAAPAVHPLTKICAVLNDLEGWHSGAGRKGAQLEARLALRGPELESLVAALQSRLDLSLERVLRDLS